MSLLPQTIRTLPRLDRTRPIVLEKVVLDDYCQIGGEQVPDSLADEHLDEAALLESQHAEDKL